MSQQVSVFAENRPGKIEKITAILKDANINIKAITIADAGDYGIIRLLLDQPQLGHSKLKEQGIAATLKPIVALKVGDHPGGLHQISEILNKNDINIDDAYGFILQNGKDAVFVFQTENIAHAEKILRQSGLEVLADNDLYYI